MGKNPLRAPAIARVRVRDGFHVGHGARGAKDFAVRHQKDKRITARPYPARGDFAHHFPGAFGVGARAHAHPHALPAEPMRSHGSGHSSAAHAHAQHNRSGTMLSGGGCAGSASPRFHVERGNGRGRVTILRVLHAPGIAPFPGYGDILRVNRSPVRQQRARFRHG